VGLLAQRLVRRLCPECRELYHPDDEEIVGLGIDPAAFRAGRARRVVFKNEQPPKPGMVFRAREGGCASCLGAGYRGRTAIYELLMIDDTIRTLANKNADGPTIKKAGMAKGMRTLRDDGAQKVLAGMTSAAEVLMMTAEDVE
jgi:general secretion pathway protein E